MILWWLVKIQNLNCVSALGILFTFSVVVASVASCQLSIVSVCRFGILFYFVSLCFILFLFVSFGVMLRQFV